MTKEEEKEVKRCFDWHDRYFGGVSPSQSNVSSLALLTNATYGENNYYKVSPPLSLICSLLLSSTRKLLLMFIKATVVVVNGTGVGQVRRVASCSLLTFNLTKPLDVPLDSTSIISIIPYPFSFSFSFFPSTGGKRCGVRGGERENQDQILI